MSRRRFLVWLGGTVSITAASVFVYVKRNKIINRLFLKKTPQIQNFLDSTPSIAHETNAGWVKYENNPVLGGKLGTCFDVSVIKKSDIYQMWFSWRPKDSIAYVESSDGIHWSDPVIVLSPDLSTGWEKIVNRPVVISRPDGYHMWYSGQTSKNSQIGYAASHDGIHWERKSSSPVLTPEYPWEGSAVMCPDVLYDESSREFRMWYSGGGLFEPDAIGYATSMDGLHWQKQEDNPIFKPDPNSIWENDRVTACQVIPHNHWFYMFYIGFYNINFAQIGIARSRDGIHNWERHKSNPIIAPGNRTWDSSAVYKPSAVLDESLWRLWYNGRKDDVEQIGLVFHAGEDLGFDD